MLEKSEGLDGGTGRRNRALLRRLISPRAMKNARFALAVCSAAVCLLVMVADLTSDVMVLKELNDLRLGESHVRGISEVEAVFNTTGRKTLVQRTLELWTEGEEGGSGDTAQLIEVCDVLKVLFLTDKAERSTSKQPNVQGLHEKGTAVT